MHSQQKSSLKLFFQKTLCILALAISIFLLILFLLVAISAFLPLFNQNQNVTTAKNVLNNRLFSTLLFTIKQAFLSMLVALAIGVPISYFIACKKFPLKRFLTSLSSVSLCVPPLLIALGYVMCFGMNGFANRFLMSVFKLKEPPLTFLYSFYGIIFAQGFYNFPLVMGTVSESWKNLSQERYDAARLCGASKTRIFFTVTLPELLSSICSSAIIVFLYCFFSFMIVLLFGVAGCSTMEVEIYQATKNTLDFNFAAKLALVETLSAMLIVCIYVFLSKKGQKITEKTLTLEEKKLSSIFEKVFLLAIILIVILFLILPLLQIVITGFGTFKKLFARSGFLQALKNTIFVGFFTSTFATIIAFCFAIIARKIDPLKKSIFLKAFPFLPMAISSLVLGLGITTLSLNFNFPKTKWILIFIQSSLCWPFALQQIQNKMQKISSDTTMAATLLSKSKTEVIFRVLIPQCKKSILIGAAFCFAISAGDATLPLILGIPRFENLALFTYRLAGQYKYAESCSVGSILMIFGIIVFALGNKQNKSRENSRLQRRKL